MNCRKCGATKVTRRQAGVFFCQHCGMQPGPAVMDRSGNPTRETDEYVPIGEPYVVGKIWTPAPIAKPRARQDS